MTPVFGLCDHYMTRWAALDPVAAGMQGITGFFGAATDYSPDGHSARAELITQTLATLAPMGVISDADRLAAGFLRERLEAQLAWHQLGEPLRLVRAPLGLISSLRDSVDLLPRGGEDDWRDIAARLAAIPAMFDGWRASLELGLARGLPAARRQAVEAAAAADRCVGSMMPWWPPTAAGRPRPSWPRRRASRPGLRRDRPLPPRGLRAAGRRGRRRRARAVRGRGPAQPRRGPRPHGGLPVGLGRAAPDRGRDDGRG